MADETPGEDADPQWLIATLGTIAGDTKATRAAVERIGDESLRVRDVRDAVGAGLEGMAARLETTVASVTRKTLEGAVERIQADNAEVVRDRDQARTERWLSIGYGALLGAVALIMLMQLLPAGWLAAPLAVRTLGGAIPAAEAMLDWAGTGERRSWHQAREIYGLYGDQLAVCAADAERRGKAVKCSVVVNIAQ